MIKILYGLILIVALITIGFQHTVIQKQDAELAELELLFDKVEKEFKELNLLGEDV
jgi:hypothetical protein